ncbi:AMP-binding protein [Rhodococcus opacus]|uniref:AMP-binding protein n=1 Tax=Rhodococcus opacus TaxID=37919 RepID=UPI0024735C8D|nr:AMP-binding protein [Rhodococcus opacus]MDH6293053.1 crotonobetaine/carnitine-CoA ligase [Rhodococcus opacus]
MKIDDPSVRTLPALLARNAEAAPDRLFLIHQNGELTRRQVWEKAQRVASGLLALGLEKGDRVAIMLDNGPELISAWFGAATAGLVEVPLNPEMGRERLLHAMRNSEASVVIADARYLGQFAAIRDDLPALRIVIVVGDDVNGSFEGTTLAALEASEIADLPEVTRADPAAIMYTSGSTGPAKGVILPHGQHYTNGKQAARQAEIRPDDRIFIVLPLHHNQAQGYGVMAALVSGAEVFIAAGFRRATFWQEANDAGATVFVFVGSLLALLGAQEGEPVNSIRVAYGAMVPKELHLEMERRFNMRIINGYGSTEGTIPIWDNLEGPRAIGSSGKVVPEFEVTIRDEMDDEVPQGGIGEICLRSREPFTMFQGYFGNAERTVQAWRNFWYHSGDRGRFDEDGNLWFEGRVDDAIRRFGEFVSANEVENAVLTLDAVELVACYGLPDAVAGQEVMLTILLRSGRALSVEQVRTRIAELLPKFAVPRFVEFADALPMTPTGKVEKHKLVARGTTDATFDARRAQERMN